MMSANEANAKMFDSPGEKNNTTEKGKGFCLRECVLITKYSSYSLERSVKLKMK